MPVKNKFYFSSSLCSCHTSVAASLQMVLWHSTTFWCWVVSLGKQKCCLGKLSFLLRLWQLFWEGTPSPGNYSLHPRCPVVWWALTVWKSLSRDSHVLNWQEAVVLGKVLRPGNVGKTALHAELWQSMRSPVSWCQSWSIVSCHFRNPFLYLKCAAMAHQRPTVTT